MNHTSKAFIISLTFHGLLLGTFIELKTQKSIQKKVIALNMNILQNMTHTKNENVSQEQVVSKEQKKEEKIESKAVEKIKPKVKSITKSEVTKEITEVIQKTNKIDSPMPFKKEDENIEKFLNNENYQQTYIKTNLNSIISAIKKHKTYPYIAQKKGIEGKAVIQCLFTTKGELKYIKILEDSNSELLNQNSIDILMIASKEFVLPESDIILTIPFNYYLN